MDNKKKIIFALIFSVLLGLLFVFIKVWMVSNVNNQGNTTVQRQDIENNDNSNSGVIEKTSSSGMTDSGVLTNTGIGNNIITGSWIMLATWITDKDQFNAIQIPDKVDMNADILGFLAVMNNDKWNETDDFYKIWRKALLNEGSDINVNALLDCIDGKIPFTQLDGLYKEICEGKNKYIPDEDTNFAHIKDQLNLFRKIKENKNFDCTVFLKKKYEYPLVNKITDSVNILRTNIETDVFVCSQIKDATFNIQKEYFLYKQAFVIGKCEYLDNKVLIQLCNEAMTYKKTAQ